MLAKDCVFWFDVKVHDFEGVHEEHLLPKMLCILLRKVIHLPSLLSGVLDAIIKDK